MSSRALLTMKCKNQPALACPIGAIRASACPMAVFSGFYESPGPPPSGAQYRTTTLQWPSARPSKWVHFASSFCHLLPWRPPGRYWASSRPMAASSNFQCSPGHAASGNAACIASTPPHGHWNGLQLRWICSLPPPFSFGIIVAKENVMVVNYVCRPKIVKSSEIVHCRVCKWHHCTVAEALIQHGMVPTSPPNIWKVVDKIHMMWMGIWHHILPVTTTWVVPDLGSLLKFWFTAGLQMTPWCSG